jgi:16S rRNA (cytosine967-C5)-methyltransferase
LGTLRAHPEVRWRRTPEDIAQLAALQGRLLRRLANLVRPGGTLTYATCTLTLDENEHAVAGFLEERPDFQRDDPRPFLPEAARPLVGSDLALRTLPHRHGLDGFYAVRLRHAPG